LLAVPLNVEPICRRHCRLIGTMQRRPCYVGDSTCVWVWYGLAPFAAKTGESEGSEYARISRVNRLPKTVRRSASRGISMPLINRGRRRYAVVAVVIAVPVLFSGRYCISPDGRTTVRAPRARPTRQQ